MLDKFHAVDVSVDVYVVISRFNALYTAFQYGAPPHGGMAYGLDRLVMQMLKCSTLREVVAYPKVQNASELMTECPAKVDLDQLEVLGIGITAGEDDE